MPVQSPNKSTTPFRPSTDLERRRLHAGRLIEGVLNEELSAGYALTRWPMPPKKDGEPDLSLQAAYQALWHFEADADRQRSELFYMDAQMELLSQISRYLCHGRPLPAHMLNAYHNSYSCREHRAGYFLNRDLFDTVFDALVHGIRRATGIATDAMDDLRTRYWG